MRTKRGKLSVFSALAALSLLVLVQTKLVTSRTESAAGARTVVTPVGKPVLSKTAVAISARPEDRRLGAGQNRKEIVEGLQHCFRKEQVKIELGFEQLRYGEKYWQTELGEKQLLELDRVRVAQLTRLTGEMNAMLDELSEGELGETMTLAPIFDAGHAGPNVTFLSPESRASVEQLIAKHAQQGMVDAARLLAEVEPLLTADEMAQYRQWNAPERVLLRSQLVGFDATENEFEAVAQWPGFVNQGNSEAGDGEQAELKLASRIGIQRLADLIRLRDPEVQTAVHDLHRLGLPLDQAESLAAFRSQGIGEIQQVWSDPVLPSPEKEERVRQLQQAYRARIAATFELSATSPDETDLMP
jgi:hypothetical protein